MVSFPPGIKYGVFNITYFVNDSSGNSASKYVTVQVQNPPFGLISIFVSNWRRVFISLYFHPFRNYFLEYYRLYEV